MQMWRSGVTSQRAKVSRGAPLDLSSSSLALARFRREGGASCSGREGENERVQRSGKEGI